MKVSFSWGILIISETISKLTTPDLFPIPMVEALN